MARKDHHRNIELAGQVAAVKRTGAAEENEREITRIESADDRNKLGRGCIWQGEIDRCAYQNHIFRVRFDPETLHPLLFHFLLQSYQAKRYFFSHAKQTSNLCTINSRELKRFEVPVPPPEEQKEMLNILEAAEDSIRSAERKIAETERVKRSLLQNLLTGRIRLREAATV